MPPRHLPAVAPRNPATPPLAPLLADIIAGAVCAKDGHFINGLMDLHMGPLMLLGGWARVR